MIIRAGMLDFLTAVVWLMMMFPYRGCVGLMRVSSQVSSGSISKPPAPVLNPQLRRRAA